MAGWCGRNAKPQSPGQDTCPVWTRVLFCQTVSQVSRTEKGHSLGFCLGSEGRPLPPTAGPPGLIPGHPSSPQELGLGWSGNRHHFLEVLTSILKYCSLRIVLAKIMCKAFLLT